ncbi:dTDP-glucose 4,6-dehydratase [plant metagenome]|uniref:dTDP-glucose 4,6-dehydratase n=1 Tax=plant metagenome TaxID=1297885 RepID=A0A484UVA0_9ZZZZ
MTATQGTASHYTILGATGFVGSHLLRHLRQTGQACLAPGRDEDPALLGDLGHVIYCIGLTADFRQRPLDTVDAHVCVLRRLLAKATFTSLTYLSSTRVYANASDTRESASLQVNPNEAGNLYNLSKLTGEALCLHGGRPHARVVRLSNVIGPRADPDTFIDQLLAEGARTGAVHLRTALASRKDYIHIDDVVALLARIARSQQGGILNVASGQGTSNAEILEILSREAGYVCTADEDAPAWQFSPIDITRLQETYGFRPRDLQEYFPSFIQSQSS